MEYTVKRPFPHQGRIVLIGESVGMHPRQAKYLLGTHLEYPRAARPRKPVRKKRTARAEPAGPATPGPATPEPEEGGNN